MTQIHEIEILFKEYYEALHRYAFSILKDTDDAKDVLQAVFINIWERRDTFDKVDAPKAYLYRAVYNESINFIKKESVRRRHQDGAGDLQNRLHDDTDPREQEAYWKQKMDQVLDQLPPQCKAVFMLSRTENKKYTEIADELGISVKTVEAHMSKALKIIRTLVGVFVILLCLWVISMNNHGGI